MPGTNWTTVLCAGLEQHLRHQGIDIRTGATVTAVQVAGGEARVAKLDDGEEVAGDLFVSCLPSPVYRNACPADETAALRTIEYTALLSMVCATSARPAHNFYWLNLATRRHYACALFNLSALNPTIGHPDTSCLNFVTHLRGRSAAQFARSDDEIVAAYLWDYERIFRRALRPSWVKLARIPAYSPVFVRNYAGAPTRSESIRNVYFAGTYCGRPTIASTGSALSSGLDTANRILREAGDTQQIDLPRPR
jgi:hypothetical protein